MGRGKKTGGRARGTDRRGESPGKAVGDKVLRLVIEAWLRPLFLL